MRPALLAALLLAATLGPATLFLPPRASASPYTWSPPELVDISGVIDQVSLALDADGNPHIAYYDAFADDLRYAHWNGTAWVLEDVDTAGDVGSSPTILVDSTDRAHVVYVDVAGRVLKHGVRDVGWQTQVIDSVGFVVEGSASAGQATDGALHACYYNNDFGALRHAWLSGGVWLNETVEGGASGLGSDCSVALDSAGNPRISYRGNTGQLRYAAWNGTAWNLTTVDAVDGVSGWTSLALNASGNPYISYLTGASEGKIVYHDGTAWRTLVAPSNAHFSPSIAFDAQDRLHAPTWGFSGPPLFVPGFFNYSVWNGAWTNETFPEKFLDATDLALDSAGDPHLAWAVDGDLYYARAYAQPQRPSSPRALAALGGNAQVSLTWTAPSWDGGSPVTNFRVYRGTAPNPTTVLTTVGNVTTYSDTTVTNGVPYYYAITAVNAVGEGPPSNEAIAVPSGPGDDPPTCAITFPAGGTVSGAVAIRGTATDPENSLDRAEVRIDGGAWNTATGTSSWTHVWNSSTVPDGTHTIQARAHDGAQYSTLCSVAVTTDNGVVGPNGGDGDFLRDYGWIIALLIVVLLAVGILVLARRRRRRPTEPEQPGSP